MVVTSCAKSHLDQTPQKKFPSFSFCSSHLHLPPRTPPKENRPHFLFVRSDKSSHLPLLVQATSPIGSPNDSKQEMLKTIFILLVVLVMICIFVFAFRIWLFGILYLKLQQVSSLRVSIFVWCQNKEARLSSTDPTYFYALLKCTFSKWHFSHLYCKIRPIIWKFYWASLYFVLGKHLTKYAN